MFTPKRRRVAIVDAGGPTMTKQSFKDECDINNILSQYRRTGVLTHIRANASAGVYTDLPSEVDYQAALHTVMAAADAFDSLPAKVRARFNNDPEQFLAAFRDPDLEDELLKLGLLKPKASDQAPGADPSPRQEASGAAPGADSPAPSAKKSGA